MYWRPSDRSTDVVMHPFIEKPRPSQNTEPKKELPIFVEGLVSRDCSSAEVQAESTSAPALPLLPG